MKILTRILSEFSKELSQDSNESPLRYLRGNLQGFRGEPSRILRRILPDSEQNSPGFKAESFRIRNRILPDSEEYPLRILKESSGKYTEDPEENLVNFSSSPQTDFALFRSPSIPLFATSDAVASSSLVKFEPSCAPQVWSRASRQVPISHAEEGLSYSIVPLGRRVICFLRFINHPKIEQKAEPDKGWFPSQSVSSAKQSVQVGS